MLTTRVKVRIARHLSKVVRALRSAVGQPDPAMVRRLGLNWSLDLTEGIDLAVYLNCYERSTFRRYNTIVPQGATVLDIGANIGLHALYLAHLAGQQGQVIAIEPTAFAFEKMQINLGLNPAIHSRVTLCQTMLMAAADKRLPGEVVSSWPLTTTQPSSTALSGAHRSTSGAEIDTVDGMVERRGLQRVDLIKIDVDGNELEILKGATKTLSIHQPLIVMELCPYQHDQNTGSFADLIQLVSDAGYDFFDISSDKPISADPAHIEKSIPPGTGMNILLRKRL
ncbi:MAG: FkbM family methyltransferase [Rhodospirillales bacterium]|nr:FkbM family methyltransferase [Rhodospirillales bacterium]